MFAKKSNQEIHDRMVKSPIVLTKAQLPPGISIEAADFINKAILHYQTLVLTEKTRKQIRT